jgi:hypothetical protein
MPPPATTGSRSPPALRVTESIATAFAIPLKGTAPAFISGLPNHLGQVEDDPHSAVHEFLHRYPSLEGYKFPQGPVPFMRLDDGDLGVFTWWDVPPEAPDPLDIASVVAQHSVVYRAGSSERYAFPAIGAATAPIHPFLLWWGALFALSMLARYEPSAWVESLNTDRSPWAVPLQTLLDHALDALPAVLYQTLADATKSS